MKTIHLLLALIVPILIVYATHADAAQGQYITSVEKHSFRYGEPLQYTVAFSGSQDPSVDYIKARIINKATGMASEWSEITLEGAKTQVTTDIIGAPFDKKGTYLLQTVYNPPKLIAYGGDEFELLDDADSQTLQGKAHHLSIPEQINAQIPASEIACSQGLDLVQKSRSAAPLCISPESKGDLIARGFVHDRTQDPEGMVFDGFDTYSEWVPLDFMIWFKGTADASCFQPKITVTDSLGDRVWSSDVPTSSCDADGSQYLESTYRLNTIAWDHPVLTAGKYTIDATFENYTVSKEIIMK